MGIHLVVFSFSSQKGNRKSENIMCTWENNHAIPGQNRTFGNQRSLQNLSLFTVVKFPIKNKEVHGHGQNNIKAYIIISSWAMKF